MRKQSLDDLGHMAVLVRVVETRSFSGAARALGTTTSAVSKRVARLEERVGARLLLRTTRSLSLTEAGAVLYERARAILRDVESAEVEVSQHSSTPRGTVRATAPTTLSESVLVPSLGRFLARWPEVSVELSVDDRYLDLVAGRFDVALRVGASVPEGTITRRLAEVPAVVVASPAYLARRPAPEHPDALLEHECLRYTLVPPRHEWRFLRGRTERSVPATGRFACDHGGALRQAALDGVGVAWMPRFMVSEDLAAGRLVQLLAGWQTRSYPIHAVLPGGRQPPPKVRAFVDFLAALFDGMKTPR